MDSVNDNRRSTNPAVPWHLWVVGALFLLVYGIGAYDYVQTRRHDVGYFDYQGYGPAQIEYFSDYPVVPLVFWTVNIVSGLAAVVFVLLRSRWAAAAAAAATISQMCLQVVTFGFMDRWNILGTRLGATHIGVLVLTAVLWWYCLVLRRRTVLT